MINLLKEKYTTCGGQNNSRVMFRAGLVSSPSLEKKCGKRRLSGRIECEIDSLWHKNASRGSHEGKKSLLVNVRKREAHTRTPSSLANFVLRLFRFFFGSSYPQPLSEQHGDREGLTSQGAFSTIVQLSVVLSLSPIQEDTIDIRLDRIKPHGSRFHRWNRSGRAALTH